MVRPRRQGLGQGQEAGGSAERGGRLGKRRREDSGEEFDRLRFQSPRHQTTAYMRTQRILTMSKEWRDRYAEGPQGEEVAERRPPTDAMIAKALMNMLDPIRIRILEKVVRSIIVPKGGDKAALTDLVKIIMVCLFFKGPLDLSRLILMMMRECAQQRRRGLGYGKLITALLRKEQFDFSSYHPMVLESAIDEEKVTAMTKGERIRRVWAQVREERAQREEEEDRSEEGSESEEVSSDSAAGGGVADFQRTVEGLFVAQV